MANMKAQPEFTFHVKESLQADLPARARVISDDEERRRVLTSLLDDPFSTEFEQWVAHSPLVEVEFL